MDLFDYPILKQKGLAQIVKLGSSYAISIQRYNIDGTLSEPEIQALSIDNVKKLVADEQKKMDALNVVIADIKALE